MDDLEHVVKYMEDAKAANGARIRAALRELIKAIRSEENISETLWAATYTAEAVLEVE